ncbi:DUF2264 domain-containing protein [Rubellicoccus peritrichatus]|uniref:Glycoside hydrolase family 88 protein n=1 Tax=Rubellicoccus peritrichatus TaxID=3080537 RepID=A0AAQ3QVF9_9BACT|nr:DUF2264 domain-containing protein [Puniceicoccus sp. CR14]WOO40845.1 glycoside hydrolase family 88 protein [Puniceicoccus sp. CR14]
MLLVSAAVIKPALALPPARTPEEVKAVMQKVADWQIEHLRDDYNRYHDADNRLVAWTYGALYVGMLKWAEMANDDTYYEFLKSIAEENEWDLGRSRYHADEQVVGQLYLELYRKYGDPKMIEKVQRRTEWIRDNPSEQPMRLNRYKFTQRWTWCDALFMAPPVWAKLSNITGDPSFRDWMFEEYKATTDHLYDPEENLFFRDEHYIDRRDHDRKVFWSRGNGWVFGSLPLIIDELPDGEQRSYYTNLFMEMAPAIADLQTEQGHWAMSLLAADIYPTPETSGTAFFTYGLAWGINNGLLDRQTYEPVVMKAWDSLVSHVSNDGMLGYVQPVGAAPGKAWADKTEVYGVGAFLAAGSEVYILMNNKPVFEIKNPDFELSPYTGMTRQNWKDAGVYLLEGAFGYVESIEDSMLFPKLPGKSRQSADAVARLETLCRTLFIAAALMRDDPDLTINGIKLADYYRYHLNAICDPESPTYIKNKTGDWPGQTLVEFGALSMSLFVAPEVLWDPLTKQQRDALAEKINSYADGPTVDSNWKFFNIIALSFLKSRGYEVNEKLLEEYLQKSLRHYRGEGWYNDNPCYDYYSVWGFQMYGIFWSHYFGNEFYPEYAKQLTNNFKEMLPDFPLMFARNGEMIMWGRSISYRFAASCVFPLATYVEDADPDWGWLRHIASANMLQFLQHPDFMEDGVPTLGFYRHFEPAVQEYLTRGSVYWMGKFWLGLATPPDHPFWTSVETEGKWPELSKHNANAKFFKDSDILLTDFTNIGGSEIRAWCHVKKNPHDHGRDSENYNRLAYSSNFPWQADGSNGEVSMAYRFKLAGHDWLSSNLYRFKKYENGVYYRDLTLEEDEGVQFSLADIPLRNGMLRVDLNRSKVPMNVRLGHYALPLLDEPMVQEVRNIAGREIYLMSNGKYQLALIPVLGWEKADFIDSEGLHPESMFSTVINTSDNFDPKSGAACYITFMLSKPAGEPWSDDELNPLANVKSIGDTLKDGCQITLTDGSEYSVQWE